MDEVVDSVKRVTDIMSEIANASAEQSAGIEQVNLSIIEMDGMTQQNAALVEQAAAAFQSLQDQASELQRVVSIFKLAEAKKPRPLKQRRTDVDRGGNPRRRRPPGTSASGSRQLKKPAAARKQAAAKAKTTRRHRHPAAQQRRRPRRKSPRQPPATTGKNSEPGRLVERPVKLPAF
jgi:hypothetical protein